MALTRFVAMSPFCAADKLTLLGITVFVLVSVLPNVAAELILLKPIGIRAFLFRLWYPPWLY